MKADGVFLLVFIVVVGFSQMGGSACNWDINTCTSHMPQMCTDWGSTTVSPSVVYMYALHHVHVDTGCEVHVHTCIQLRSRTCMYM